MAKIISIAGQKGGIGRSTFNQNISAVLAKELNKKVLLIDTDGQANLTLVNDINPDEINNGISKIFVNEDVVTRDCILNTQIEKIDLIPSNEFTYSTEQDLYKRSSREFVLHDAIQQIKDFYDYIFIDVPPSLNVITLNAMVASNYVILLYTASEFSLEGLSQLLDTYYQVKKNPRLDINNVKIVGAVQNRFKIQNKRVNRKLKEELEGLDIIPRFFSPVSDSTIVEQSQFAHKPVIEFNLKHKVADEFRRLTREFIEYV